MILWLTISILVVVVLLVLMSNQANLAQAPGALPRLKIFLSSNVAELSRKPLLPELEAPHFRKPPAEMFRNLIATVQTLGWEITERQPDHYALHVVVTSRLWRFKDDIQLQIHAEGDGSYLAATSRSRLGRADLAANSGHLQKLVAALQADTDR